MSADLGRLLDHSNTNFAERLPARFLCLRIVSGDQSGKVQSACKVCRSCPYEQDIHVESFSFDSHGGDFQASGRFLWS